MKKEKDLRLSAVLIDWYDQYKRDLPWRNTHDPYKIWLSEVILQQTRVDQGYDYYMRFVDRFATINDLANADEQEVLKLWQGLGYYSRARNLHATAKIIADNYNGVFPKDYKDILSLRGIGEYTAAAIVSFAYNLPYAVVDGNVYRVLSRVFAIDDPIDTTQGKKVFAELAQLLLDEDNAGLHNQAIMEFGALQCVPASPNCSNCPASSFCLAFAENKISSYPVKQGKVKVRNRYFNYFDIRYDDSMFLNKRTEKDIWQNLYEFPLIETDIPMNLEKIRSNPLFADLFTNVEIELITPIVEYKHVLSHQIIYASFYRIEIKQHEFQQYLKIKTEEVEDYPVSRLVHKYLEKL